MNKVILMGRLVRDPEVRYTQAENPMAVSRYTLAIDRRGIKKKKEIRSRKQTLSIALLLGNPGNLRRSIFTAGCVCWFPEESRPALTSTKTAIKSTRRMSLWRSRSSQIARIKTLRMAALAITSRAQDQQLLVTAL